MLFLLILIPIVVGMWAQSRVMGKYKQWSQVFGKRAMTGAQAAEAVMRQAGIYDVEIIEVPGMLTDHYNPQKKQLALSRDNYTGQSLAALGVAAHEAGHAIQHKEGYAPLQWRAGLIPITTFASKALPFIVIGGFFFGVFGLIKLGVAAYLVLTVFQLVTLPVEFDASKRARKALLETGIIYDDEVRGVVETLNAAGMTYVAAFVASLANLLYFFMLSRND